MSLLTAELICMLIAAWKAPARAKELGLLALVTGIFFQLLSLFHGLAIYQQAGNISPTLFAGGIRVSLIPTLYGLLIYAVSLLVRLFRKPRT